MFCTNCGMPVPDGAKFCTNCGNLIDEPSSKPSGEMSPEKSQAWQDGAAQTRVMQDGAARTRVMEGGSPAAGGYPGAARRGAGSGPVGDTAGFSGLESVPYAQPYEESAYVGTSQQKGGRGRIVAAIVAGVVVWRYVQKKRGNFTPLRLAKSGGARRFIQKCAARRSSAGSAAKIFAFCTAKFSVFSVCARFFIRRNWKE